MPEEFTTKELEFIEDTISLAGQADAFIPISDSKPINWEIKDRVINKIEKMKIDLKARE